MSATARSEIEQLARALAALLAAWWLRRDQGNEATPSVDPKKQPATRSVPDTTEQARAPPRPAVFAISISSSRYQKDSKRRKTMSPLIINNTNSAPGIDPGSYVLELTGVRQVEVNDFDNPGQKAARIQLAFRIADHPRWGGAEFADLCTVFFGRRSKLGQILAALNSGVPVPAGEIDLEAFVGRRLRATVRRTDAGYNRVVPETALPLDHSDREDA